MLRESLGAGLGVVLRTLLGDKEVGGCGGGSWGDWKRKELKSSETGGGGWGGGG